VNQEDLLPPEKAFAVSVERQPDHLLLQLKVADSYYVYRDRCPSPPSRPACWAARCCRRANQAGCLLWQAGDLSWPQLIKLPCMPVRRRSSS
jgi:hypothetical protein